MSVHGGDGELREVPGGPHSAHSRATAPRLPVTVAFSQLRRFERTAPDGAPPVCRPRSPQQLQPGDVFGGQRDRWAVVARVTCSGPGVALRVQEAGGSRTIMCGARAPVFNMRADLRIDPATIPDIPDGFPPRWGVWRSGPRLTTQTVWFPGPGKASRHARKASRDGSEYVVELESPDGSWTQVDAYQHGRRSPWGKQLAAGQGKTAIPPWAVPAARPGMTPARQPSRSGTRASRGSGENGISMGRHSARGTPGRSRSRSGPPYRPHRR